MTKCDILGHGKKKWPFAAFKMRKTQVMPKTSFLFTLGLDELSLIICAE